MATKCPMCGAPMKNNSCDYCGYEEEAIPNLTTASSYAERQLIQPQVIINNQIVSSPEAAPEISRKTRWLLCCYVSFWACLAYTDTMLGKLEPALSICLLEDCLGSDGSSILF